MNQAQVNQGELSIRYVTWDIRPLLCEYLEQHVVQPEVVQELCGRALLLFAEQKDAPAAT
jgi:hypothetical protein